MGRTIDRITHQVDDVLNFVRAKPLIFGNNDLIDLLNSAIRYINKPQGITINLPSNTTTLHCDGKQLEIVFYNLINNSSIFSNFFSLEPNKQCNSGYG